MSDERTKIQTDWECEVCHTEVIVRKPLRVGQSAAETTADTVNDVVSVSGRHKHELPPAS